MSASVLPEQTAKRPNRFKRFLPIVLLLAALSLLAYGAIGLRDDYRVTHAPTPVIADEVVENTTDKPQETPPDCDAYMVPADQPRKISLPSIGADGCIQRVGVDQHNAVAVPTNVYVAGWFTDSVLPGDVGVSLIDGHVQGRYKPGIFKKLSRLKPGDKFSVEFGSRQKRQFAVVSVDTYLTAEAAQKMLAKHDGVERQLTLITCGGTFDRKSQQYDKRVIVVSKRLTD